MLDRDKLADTLREMILAICLTRELEPLEAAKLAIRIVDQAYAAADHMMKRAAPPAAAPS